MIDKFYVATSAGQIHGRRVGAGDVPVILLHRTPMSSASFARVISHLE